MSDKVALNWINGEWVDSPKHSKSIDPATGNEIGTFADATLENAKEAIRVAKKTFYESDWRVNRRLRAQVLNEMADRFEENAEKLIQILMLENGKVRDEAEFEFSLVVPKIRFYAAVAMTQYGRAMETQPGKFSQVLTEPMGVAGIIAPWNSPIILMIRSLVPALAAGCTAVIKLPAQTSQVNYAINEVFASIKSLPKGVINQMTESGNDVAAELIESPDVPTVSFTGSTRTGTILMRNGADQLKRLGFELGGKTPMIVLNDADMEKTIPVLVKALTTFAGQFCMTGSRILLQSGIAEEWKKRLAEEFKNVKVGPASDKDSFMGPLIDKDNVERVDKIVEKAISEGAKVLERGGPIKEGELAKGAFYKPCLLEVFDNSMEIVQEETFGPVATVQVFDTLEEGAKLANDNKYGLSASVWSNDVDRPWQMVREIDAGTVWINDWAIINDEFEEGGYKMSGLGRLNGLTSIIDFVEHKHIYHNSGVMEGSTKKFEGQEGKLR
ncbi:aldehyde dehydrogenase family protein [Flavobacteriaceae bacterium Ap0902]|nr:aldehyde dehydrogenase family protein [Flavobacteriaceae bacterium Ap0902]